MATEGAIASSFFQIILEIQLTIARDPEIKKKIELHPPLTPKSKKIQKWMEIVHKEVLKHSKPPKNEQQGSHIKIKELRQYEGLYSQDRRRVILFIKIPKTMKMEEIVPVYTRNKFKLLIENTVVLNIKLFNSIIPGDCSFQIDIQPTHGYDILKIGLRKVKEGIWKKLVRLNKR